MFSFCQNWPARPVTLQGKCNNLKNTCMIIPRILLEEYISSSKCRVRPSKCPVWPVSSVKLWKASNVADFQKYCETTPSPLIRVSTNCICIVVPVHIEPIPRIHHQRVKTIPSASERCLFLNQVLWEKQINQIGQLNVVPNLIFPGLRFFANCICITV